MRKKFNRRRNFQGSNGRKDETGSINCYECNKPGDIKKDCPNLKEKLSSSRKRKLCMCNEMNRNQVILRIKKKMK